MKAAELLNAENDIEAELTKLKLNQLKNIKFQLLSHELFSHPTLNIGTISGGAAHNVVPAKCEVKLDIRYLPGETEKEIVGNINEIITSIKKNIY